MPETNGHAKVDEAVLRRLDALVGNTVMARSQLMSKILDPRRDIDDECGYPKTTAEIEARECYRTLFEREAVASRVVKVFPVSAFQVTPKVYESEDAETITEFEEAWDDLPRQVRGKKSYYKGEEGNPILNYLCRADIQSGAGHYGVILVGIDDGRDLREPADMRPEKKEDEEETPRPSEPRTARATGNAESEKRKITYLRVFPEWQADITRIDDDITSPRYGQPLEYNLSFVDPHSQRFTASGTTTNTRTVHWTRVVHICAEEVFHVPKMKPVLNRLLDIRKLYSGSAEMYWKGAFPGYTFETDPSLGGDVEFNVEAARDTVENLVNGLQRYSILNGLSMKGHPPQVVDPTPQINTQIEAICIELDIPKRKFVGSERGELSSSQDEGDWNDRLRQYMNGHLTPNVFVPFIDRLIALFVLPEPEDGYTVWWPDLATQTENEIAQVALTKTQAAAAYIAGQVNTLVPEIDFLTSFLGMEDAEAQEMLEEAEKAAEEQMKVEEELAAEQAEAMAEANPNSSPNTPQNGTLPNGQPAPVPLSSGPKQPFGKPKIPPNLPGRFPK